MNSYKIKIKDKPCFCGVEKALINNSVWDKEYRPMTYGQIIFVPGDGFYVKLTCKETYPLARFTEFYEPVYKDSCMEFFANFNPEESDIYVNFEMNSFGTLLCGVGDNRHGRKKITEYGLPAPEVEASSDEDSWSVTLHATLSSLESVYGKLDFKAGYKFKGNMYKCGDETPVLHHLMWNPVEVEEPDFHVPAFFGDFEIVE